MESLSTIPRVLASRRFLAVAIAGLVLAVLVALYVQQGLTDRETVAAYPLTIGPYLSVLGLNHAGSSLFTWFWILLIALHVGAVLLERSAKEGSPFLKRSVSVPLALLAVPALAGLLFTGLAKQDPRVKDTTRLDVSVTYAGKGKVRQIVEEGASYVVPGKGGERTLSFGTVTQGPYALEKSASGTVRAHVPTGGRNSEIGVRARRPAALSAGRGAGKVGSGWAGVVLDLAAPIIALFLLLAVVAKERTRSDTTVSGRFALAIIGFLLLVANPFSGPGGSMFPVTAGNGTDASFLVRVLTPGDVAAWNAEIPVVLRARMPRLLVSIGAAIALFGVIAIAARRVQAVKLLVATSGVAMIAAAVVDLAYALARIPIARSSVELEEWFSTTVLPRVDMAESVLNVQVSSQGPYAIGIVAGLATGLALAAVGASLFLMSREGRSGGPGRMSPGFGTALILLSALAIARALSVLLFSLPQPPGAAPFAMAALVVLSAVGVISLLHPDWESGILATAVAASSMQLALV